MTRNAKKLGGRRAATLLGALLAMALLAVPASALGAPVLNPRVSHYEPATVGGGAATPAGTFVRYDIVVSNTGDVDTSGSVDIDFTLPAGLRIISAVSGKVTSFGFDALWNCTTAPDAQSVRCSGPLFFGFPSPISPGQEACQALGGTCRISVIAKADPRLSPGVLSPSLRVCGGSATPLCAPDLTDPTQIGPPPEFDLTHFDGGVFDDAGEPISEAGSRPHSGSTDFFLTTQIRPDGFEWATQDLKDVIVDLPPGFVGNPQAVGTCTFAQLQGVRGAGTNQECPSESQVGVVGLWQQGSSLGLTPGRPGLGRFEVFNIDPPRGTAALLAFKVAGTIVSVTGELRTGGDYGIKTLALNAPIVLPVVGVDFKVWGVPADPANDPERSCPSNGRLGCSSNGPLVPFLTLPTSCDGPVSTDIRVTGWMGGSTTSSFLSHDRFGDPLDNVNCAALGSGFRPTLKARPTTNTADSPSGLEVDLGVPQNNTCSRGPPVSCAKATAHLRDTVVTLPEGLNVNPSSANGLGACSPAQADLRSEGPSNCPDNSKLGTVEIETPLLDHPVPGAVYLATPYDNPFGTLLALYIAIDDPETGVIVKVAGKVEADPRTGQLTSTFEDNPQLPFSNLRVDFFGGAGGSLRTPAVCGDYETTSSLTPWSAPDSGPPEEPSDPWSIVQGPNGAPCANSQNERSNSPVFDAGSESPIANAYTPFVVNLRRDDATQEFSAVTVSPPPGLVAKLAGTQTCSADALAAAEAKTGREEQASPSCPAASEVGSVNAAAGAGPAPYNAPGRAYLTGPYKGAPLSMAVITPAVAGPFDLGNVVTKVALQVNSKTAEITAKADPIPHILQGIPLDVRSIAIKMDKPQFTLNPTNCDPMAVNGLLTSTLGQTAALTSRFQLGECRALGFKPNMVLTLRGGTRRGKHPALTVSLMPRPGDANIASFSLAMPRSEFLENAHIRTICTRPDFAADNCPAGAIYGTSTVDTPLLDYDLTGNVYLRSSDNLLPDVVLDLRGPSYQPIRLESANRIDSIRGGIRSTADFVPDAPFTKALVQMQGGSKGLLVNSRDICARTYRATAKYTAHNGLTYTAHPKLRARCGRRAKRGGRAKRAQKR